MTLGLYGKLPIRGDFIRRGMPADLVAAWDRWASAGIQQAREQLGDVAFAEAWDEMPHWCFALPEGACGTAAIAGVMAPSRDAVGRRYPLLIAAPVASPAPSWFAGVEDMAAEAVAGRIDPDSWAPTLPDMPGDGMQGWWNAALEWPVPALPPPRHFVRFLGHAPT